MNRNPPSAGIVYYAIGEKWTGEMVRSARSVKTCMPELPIAVFSDNDLREALVDEPLDHCSTSYCHCTTALMSSRQKCIPS